VGIQDNIAALHEVAKADEIRLGYIKSATEFWNQEKNQRRAEEQLKLSKAHYQLAVQEAAERAIDRKDKREKDRIIQEAESNMLLYANLARKADGLPEYTSTADMKSKIGNTKQQQEIFEDQINRGRAIADNMVRTAKGDTSPGTYAPDRFGATVEATLKYLRAVNLQPRTNAEKRFIDILVDAEAEAPKMKSPDKEKNARDFVIQAVREQFERYKPGDSSNPNAPVTLGTLANDPLISSDPLFRKVILPTITAESAKQVAEPNLIYSLVTNALVTNPKEFNPASAAKLISNIYSKSVEYNNKNNQTFKWLGYQPESITSAITVDRGSLPRLTSDAVAATGLALLATGAGAVPAAAVTALGIGAKAAIGISSTINVKHTDPVKVQEAIVKLISAKFGNPNISVSEQYLAPEAGIYFPPN